MPHFFRIRKYPIPVTEEVRRRLLETAFQRRSSRGNFIVPAPASVSSHAGHSLKAALGTITFLCHRFVQYLYLLYACRRRGLSMAVFVTVVFQSYSGQAGHRVGTGDANGRKTGPGMFMQAIGCLPPPRAAELARLGRAAGGWRRCACGSGGRQPVRTAIGRAGDRDFAPVTASGAARDAQPGGAVFGT